MVHACMSVTAPSQSVIVYPACFNFTHGLLTLTLQCSLLPLLSLSWHEAMNVMFNFPEIFECAHLKFTVSGRSDQTNRHMCTIQSC